MAVTHPAEVVAAIASLTEAGVSAPEIRRRLGAGEIPSLPEYEIPLRTVQKYAQQAKRNAEPELGDDDVATVNALERKILGLVRREVARLTNKSRDKGLGASDAQALRAHHATVAQIRSVRKREKAPEKPLPPGVEESNRAQAASPATMLHKIAADLERNGDAGKS